MSAFQSSYSPRFSRPSPFVDGVNIWKKYFFAYQTSYIVLLCYRNVMKYFIKRLILATDISKQKQYLGRMEVDSSFLTIFC